MEAERSQPKSGGRTKRLTDRTGFCGAILRGLAVRDGDVTLFWLFAALYSLAYLPILARGGRYVDDMGRTLTGNLEWSVAGRHFADLLFWAMSFGSPALDISPLPQLLAIPVLALSSTLFCGLFPAGPVWLRWLAVSPIGLQPYWLENVSYRFDALGMAVALLCAVLPWSLRLAPRSRFLASVAAGLISLGTYQPSFNVFCVIWVFSLIGLLKRSFLPSPERSRFVQVSIAGLASLLVYIPLAYWSLPANDYVLGHAALPDVGRLSGVVLANGRAFARIVVSDWASNVLGWLVLAIVLLGLLALVADIWLRRPVAGPRPSPGWLLVATALVPALAFAVQAIELPLLAPVWQARTFVGAGALMALCGASLAGLGPRFLVWPLLGAQCFGLCMFCFVYANALAAQNEYDRHVGNLLVHDIEAVRAKTPISQINFDGASGYAPAAENAIRKYPVLRRMVPLYLRERWNWGVALLNLLGLPLRHGTLSPDLVRQTVCSQTPLVTTSRYSLFKVQETVVVRFAATAAPCGGEPG